MGNRPKVRRGRGHIPATPDDPRRVSTAGIVGPGGPRDASAVLVDASRAVLLDYCNVAMIETHSAGAKGICLAMALSGRINKTTDRTTITYLFDADGAAAIVTELVALATGIGPEFAQLMQSRMAALADEDAIGDSR